MSMKVTIEFFATLREKFGKKREVIIDCNLTTLRDVLSKINGLLEEISENESIKRMYKILLNGLNVEFLGGLDAKVKSGDEIYIFPPAGGG